MKLTLGLQYSDKSKASWDFTAGMPPGFSCVRPSDGYARTSGGVWVPFGPNVPRRTDAGLTVEPARTNIVPYSDNLSTWVKVCSNATPVPVVTPEYAIAPDGTQTASRVQITLPGDSHLAVASWGSLPTSIGSEYNASVFFKATDASQVGKKVNLGLFLPTEMVVACQLSAGWTRVSVSNTQGSGIHEIQIGKSRSTYTNGATNAEAATDFLVWGAVVEEGSVATSPIRTSGGSVTRAADAVTCTLPPGTTGIRYTFDDGSTQDAWASLGTYTLSTNLNRTVITKMKVLT